MKTNNDLKNQDMIILSRKGYEAIRNVLLHYLEDETRDFEARGKTEKENRGTEARHVYSDLLCLADWHSTYDSKKRYPKAKMNVLGLIDKLQELHDLTEPVEYAAMGWEDEEGQSFIAWVMWVEHGVVMGDRFPF